MRTCTTKSVVLGIVGILLVVIGSAFCFFWPAIFQNILRTELPLSRTSRSFDLWSDTTELPVNLEFYFFNWTNPEELLDKTKKPNLVQVGPYTFVEKRKKENITFHPENNTVSYLQKRTWYFDQDNSNGSLEDRIIHLNVVAVSAAHKVRYWGGFVQNSLSYILNKIAEIHVVKTVDELLFTGYSDTILNMGSLVPDGEEIPPYDRFGWFYKRNGSTDFDGVANMATGMDDINNLGLMKNWNYKDTTKFYKSPCNAVEGSAGEFFPPNRSKDEITMFSADMCRPITYEYAREVEHLGILGYRYELGEKTLGNETWRRYPHEQAKYFEATTTTEDFFEADTSTAKTTTSRDEDPDLVNMGHCYCNGECSPMGVINITACRYGAPGFISLPHFLNGDPMLRNQVTGLNPNAEEHSFYITLEPTTGIPIDVAARLQINILLQPTDAIALFKHVPRIYFPIFWFNLRSGVTNDLASSMRQLLMLPDIGLYSGKIIAAIGSLILVVVAVMLYCRNQRSRSSGSRKVAASKGKKTELVYMDSTNGDDDKHARNDRQLYPKL